MIAIVTRAAAAMAVALLAACATPVPERSGFLGDYSLLKPDRYGKGALLWTEKPGFDWRRYRKLMIDPVLAYDHPQAGNRSIQADAVQKLALHFHEVVVAGLKGSYEVTTAPGPDVLRVRAAITDVVQADPTINAVTTVVAFVPLDLDGAAIEAEFVDSVTGKRLAAMVERKKGGPLNLAGGFTELGHAKAAFAEWAAELKRALQTNP